MSNLSKKDLDIFSNKILEGYDSKNPSAIFKDKIKINNGAVADTTAATANITLPSVCVVPKKLAILGTIV